MKRRRASAIQVNEKSLAISRSAARSVAPSCTSATNPHPNESLGAYAPGPEAFAVLRFTYPESFDRQLGDRVNKRLKRPRAPLPGLWKETMQDTRERLESILRKRIAVVDGSWGVLLQREVHGEEGYRGEWFRDHSHDVAGDPDLLNLTQPELISRIHGEYFAAGADLATTNTFTATTIGQADYGLDARVVEEMNLAGARLARAAADEWEAKTGRPRIVAGSVGPLNVSLSLSPKVEDPSYRDSTFDDVAESYAHQIRALRKGGVDLLLIETVFDTLNAKAAIAAAQNEATELPLW